MVSRSEGYRRAAGKEETSLRVVQGFFRRVLGVELERIDGADENYRLGDFRAGSGATMECKSQPIDPVRYPLNFVEVFEVTTSARHAAGFDDVAALLGMSPEQLAGVTVDDRRPGRRRSERLGPLSSVSVSIRSIAGSALTIYVNPLAGHVYIYRSDELMEHLIRAVRAGGLKRGMGRSNEDTFAVQVPLSEWRWSADSADEWEYRGIGDEREAIEAIQTLCLPEGSSANVIRMDPERLSRN